MSQKFRRNIEDFRCENCGASVEGNGYTNHCPKCLYSKHVDIMPGDRAATCGGLMEPETVEQQKNGYDISHRCLECGFSKINKSVEGDSFEKLVSIAKKAASRASL